MNRVLERRLKVGEAARLLGISERHGWRLLAAYRKEGAAALAHGNRGSRPGHALGEESRTRVRDLAQGRYQGVNHCHLTELLVEREGLGLSRSTVRRILATAGIRSPRRRRPPGTASGGSATLKRECSSRTGWKGVAPISPW
ncbi:MAG: helix-turn-helix domain-containing protein [Chloroflexi bacterium]|nr:helix-turn-helix domain-containing protein [Chloroflexota bacterium]